MAVYTPWRSHEAQTVFHSTRPRDANFPRQDKLLWAL